MVSLGNIVAMVSTLELPENAKETLAALDELSENIRKLTNPVNMYSYSYFNLDSNGNLIRSVEDNVNYGSTREGYERWKSDTVVGGDIDIGYAGVISAREVYHRETQETIGYVFEKKETKNTYFDVMSAGTNAFDLLCSVLDVKNMEAFKYYVDTYHYNINKSIGSTELENINAYKKIINNYFGDADYKAFIDIIKG